MSSLKLFIRSPSFKDSWDRFVQKGAIERWLCEDKSSTLRSNFGWWRVRIVGISSDCYLFGGQDEPARSFVVSQWCNATRDNQPTSLFRLRNIVSTYSSNWRTYSYSLAAAFADQPQFSYILVVPSSLLGRDEDIGRKSSEIIRSDWMG